MAHISKILNRYIYIYIVSQWSGLNERGSKWRRTRAEKEEEVGKLRNNKMLTLAGNSFRISEQNSITILVKCALLSIRWRGKREERRGKRKEWSE